LAITAGLGRAERLFISQPALSKQIRLLERDLRVTLFVREKRRVRLTEAGQTLVFTARDLLQTWAEGQQQLAVAAAAAEAAITVGFSTSIGRGIIPAVRDAMTERRPDYRMQLRQVPWTDPSAGLADRSTDVALVWLPVPVAGIATHAITTEARHVALPATHRLAGRGVVEFVELLAEPFLALPTTAGPLRDYWLALDARDGAPPVIAGEVRSAEETFESIENGIGIALLSAGNAEIYRRDTIVTVPVHGIAPSELAVAWRSDDHRPVIRDFVDVCSQVAKSAGAIDPENGDRRPR
jgi:DNA-binding transcriptional LysR family regulator